MAVQDRSKKMTQLYQDREMIRAIRGGTKTMREAGEKYLPREAGESPTSYKRRIARSTFANFMRETIESHAAKPHAKPYVFNSAKSQELADDYLKRADSKGTSSSQVGYNAVEDACWNGTSLLLVDAPESGGRPYFYNLSMDSVLDYDLDEDGLLTYFRIAEKITVRDGEFDVKELGRVRVFKREKEVVTWDLWEESDGGKYSSVSSGNRFPLDFIPVFPVHAGPVAPGEFFADPPLMNLAYLNVQHWQESSDQAHILHVAKVPVLFASGVAEDAQISIGSEYAIKADSGSDLKWVEISGASINAGRQSIVDLESKMMRAGLEMLQNNGATETATGMALRAGENNNKVAQIASNLEAALEKTMFTIGKFNMISEPDFAVSVHKDYGINASTEEISALVQARTLGDLSQEDFLNELKRRSILRPEFNIEDNRDRISAEMV
nr:DUF4055 domain-containing protein [Pseudomonas sp. s4]